MTEVYRSRRAVLYKHSPACWLSLRALREVSRVARGYPDPPVSQVDVLAQGALSRRIAADLGIRHESPQVILLERGQPAWHVSHMAVTADAITRWLGDGAGE